MSRTVAGLLFVFLLVAAAAVAGTKEIRVQLFLEPDLDLEGSEKILIGPVLIEPRLDDPASTLDLAASREFDGYLRTLLRRELQLKDKMWIPDIDKDRTKGESTRDFGKIKEEVAALGQSARVDRDE